MTLDLRRVAAFVAIAKELNVTRAAERLHVTQQALSASLNELERHLGVRLIDRTPRQLRLTPAGAVLLAEAVPLLASAAAVERKVATAGSDASGRLVLAHSPAIAAEEIYRLLADFRTAQPDATVVLEKFYPRELSSILTSGRANIALVRVAPRLGGDTAAFATTPVSFDRLRVAVNAEHPLASKSYIALPDLAQYEIVVWASPGTSGYTSFLTSLCRSSGFEPNVAVSPNQGLPPVTSVAGNKRVAFVTDPAGMALDGAVRVITLEPPVYAPLEAVWLRAGLSQWAQRFLDTVRTARHE
ncbi:LysR family transcriptional regulator [Hoyosella sp. YIM 151337]|uniref:LysR family transcriptional regulator n=1 Tax=Hoyosella sp. YIM 151337 TaxID=2992742 RepID=UPI00223683CA|nr:LysR family transcriptional regulator [Hoyosella sp. YIM 151337]MCW4353785.1 LysR family transcriptional regulator [Hoyosella sp. YIM 151337]